MISSTNAIMTGPLSLDKAFSHFICVENIDKLDIDLVLSIEPGDLIIGYIWAGYSSSVKYDVEGNELDENVTTSPTIVLFNAERDPMAGKSFDLNYVIIEHAISIKDVHMYLVIDTKPIDEGLGQMLVALIDGSCRLYRCHYSDSDCIKFIIARRRYVHDR